MPRTGLEFNHVIVYSRDVDRSLKFYHDLLGFRIIEHVEGYARLRSPRGRTTLALHQGVGRASDRSLPVVLYFETPDLVRFCRRLRRARVRFEQLPKKMPWGWTHAYLRDPDGHSVSLYWAGRQRFRKTGVN